MQPDINSQLLEHGLRAEVLPVDLLQKYQNNPNEHTEESYASIQDSIDTFGFKNIILVDKDYEIIHGHGRLEAAIRAGYDKLPVLIAVNIDKVAAAAFRIAHNATAKKSEWDLKSLLVEIDLISSDGFDIAHTGFSLVDVESMSLKLDDLHQRNDSDSQSSSGSDNSSLPEDDEAEHIYRLRLANNEERSAWFAFLDEIAVDYPGIETIGERIVMYLENSGILNEA